MLPVPDKDDKPVLGGPDDRFCPMLLLLLL